MTPTCAHCSPSPTGAPDVHPIVRQLLDTEYDIDGNEISSFEEFQAKWAPNIVVGFGRLAGPQRRRHCQQSAAHGGCLNSLSAEKASRFVRSAMRSASRSSSSPTFPGYLPGVGQNGGGRARGAKRSTRSPSAVSRG